MKKTRNIILCFILIVTVFAHCSKNSDAADTSSFSALPLTVIAPADNPQTAEKVALGRVLFWDPVLSGGKDVACASCHHPASGYSDGLDLSIGVNGQGLGAVRHFMAPNSIPFAKRNALSIINTGFNGITAAGIYTPSAAAMFFDNRIQSLEAQSLEPIKTMEEMRAKTIAASFILDTVVQRLRSIPQYEQLFTEAFGAGSSITAGNMGKAIAAYERSIVSNQSPYDQYMRGNRSALTAAQIQGMNAFADNGCNKCHSGPMFSDYSLHVLSVPDNPKLPSDAGTNNTYAFRTPGLRNLSFTAPYMHSGVFSTLNQVLNFYDQIGEGRSQNPHVGNNRLDGSLQRLNNRDQNVIIEFLKSLNDNSFDKTIPPRVPSGLHPGGNI